MLLKFVSTVVPVYLITSCVVVYEHVKWEKTHFKNSMRVRLVKTMRVESQSIMPVRNALDVRSSPGSTWHLQTEVGGPVAFLVHVDDIRGREPGGASR